MSLRIINEEQRLVSRQISDAKVWFRTMQEPRTKRTELSVQVQSGSVHDYWAVSSVLGSTISKPLRTRFEPVRTELSTDIFFVILGTQLTIKYVKYFMTSVQNRSLKVID